jgi:hypothetical protein
LKTHKNDLSNANLFVRTESYGTGTLTSIVAALILTSQEVDLKRGRVRAAWIWFKL